MIGNETLLYMDDIVIFSTSFEEHLQHLKNVLNHLRTCGFIIQLDKCEFAKTSLTYLGHVISEKGLQPLPEKTNKIRNFPRPTCVKKIQSFLGFCKYYQKFIKNYAHLAKSLTSLLRKNVKFIWSEECEKSFQSLRNAITDELTLAFFIFDKTFFLHADASNYAIGAVLSQKDKNGDLRPITYASKTLNVAECRYATIEKELYAVVWAIKQFRAYLLGQRFVIYSDHKPLVYAMRVNDPSHRLLKWRLKLQEHNYVIQHIPGKTEQSCRPSIQSSNTAKHEQECNETT